MSYHTHFKQPTNICFVHGCLVTYKNSNSYLNSFVRYWSLKNPAVWLVKRFLHHNSRTRFFPGMMFVQKLKRPLVPSYWSKKKHIRMDKIFFKILKTSLLGYFRTFWALLAWLNLFCKTRIHQFSYLMMHKIIKKKQQVLMI